MLKHKSVGETRKRREEVWGGWQEVRRLGSRLGLSLPAGKSQRWRFSALRAPGGPAGLATSAAPARGPQGGAGAGREA